MQLMISKHSFEQSVNLAVSNFPGIVSKLSSVMTPVSAQGTLNNHDEQTLNLYIEI